MRKQITKSSPIPCTELASLLRMVQVFRMDLVAVDNYSSGSTTRHKFAPETATLEKYYSDSHASDVYRCF